VSGLTAAASAAAAAVEETLVTCDKEVKFKSLLHHFQTECEFVLVKCPYDPDCNGEFPRSQLEDHLTTECDRHKVNCIKCGEKILKKNEHQHLLNKHLNRENSISAELTDIAVVVCL
jgi:hypothetical protein